jgi:two-component system OmpR family response regulator
MTPDGQIPRAIVAVAERSLGDRAGPAAHHPAAAATLRAGDLVVDQARWTVHKAGIPVELSPTEFRLLVYLMRNQGRVLTREQILAEVWNRGADPQLQIVATYVSYLRRKLDPLGPPLIHTQRGAGYSLQPEHPEHPEPAHRWRAPGP